MKRNIVVILCSFHQANAVAMLDEVRNYALENKITIIDEIWVPGAMEVPLTLKRELMQNDIDGAVILGTIEAGETKHGLVMANVVMNSIINIQIEQMKPVGVGILGPEIHPSQMLSRVKPYAKAAAEALKTLLLRSN
ncbi:6,7-dimethyl-8-ribityllumazine synthase [Vibrio coralliilyticus]|uniref:6,7-dimethyl-8-ribityllumazine synthase n=1 Tax=Vibrio coralliilyticus TaxID=190893 RepID=UPI0015613E36|nr:6,7-dimethyl-8-ribityllumazine synthase [Vibrio coralliilyticus]NRF28144.1 6,7-dimethyl-8-ribityllumazine synthase [Vibrio coralliilyticus]NRF82272.1 6,7-dimethyl-8-ribityllumazine synthase [Vibrio coralliilyticus]